MQVTPLFISPDPPPPGPHKQHFTLLDLLVIALLQKASFVSCRPLPLLSET